jgi:OFA family oxalate/formate antiporter-like MFS transporter
VSGYKYSQLLAKDAPAARALVADAPTLEKFKAEKDRLAALFREENTQTPEYSALQAATENYRTVLIYDKTSIALAFLFLGVIYLCVMVPSALYIAPPPDGYAEQFAAAMKSAQAKSTALNGEMSAMEAIRTPGFYGLWLMLFINVSCGIAVIATAKKMGYEMVRLPVEMASLLVMGISLFNGLGRIIWASLSDFIGRSNTYVAFFAIQIVCFPLLANLTGSPIAFMLVTFLILTCYGGGFASIPAYISDLFGLKEMPTIHGFILTAWSLAGIVGPMLNAYVYEQTNSYQQSLYVFGGAFVIALIIALMMKLELKRLHRHYSALEVESARTPTTSSAASNKFIRPQSLLQPVTRST